MENACILRVFALMRLPGSIDNSAFDPENPAKMLRFVALISIAGSGELIPDNVGGMTNCWRFDFLSCRVRNDVSRRFVAFKV